MGDSSVDVLELAIQEPFDALARSGSSEPDLNDPSDLGEGQPGGLRALDEPNASDRVVVVWFRVYRSGMNLTLLYFDGCPNWRTADERIERLRGEFPGIVVTRRLVDTPEEAEEIGFRGSPTILVDGVDPFGDAEDPVGLTCRLYQTPDGPAGSPTYHQLRAVLAAAGRG